MFYLTCFDLMSVVLTFVTVVLVQFLNSYLKATDKATAIDEETTRTFTATIVTNTANVQQQQQQQQQKQTNGTLQKQKSTQSDDASTTIKTSPPTSARNSLKNGCIPHLPSQDSLCDEYHEDEDTLSLENLFPCDQSEIYASKKISFIIDELIQTEENYVNNLRKGLANYGNISDRKDLPEVLQNKDKRSELLGNIEEIIVLHERHILPMMLKNHNDLKQLFDDFAGYFDKNQFYCYVVFTMNKKASMQLRQENREWFTALQNELNDKLGIDSFLVQPIQRLTRYPLLLQQFISEIYKSGINCKPVLTSVCKLETRMRRLLEVVNQAEEVLSIDEISEISILSQGNFRKSSEFEAYHHRSRKKYHAKVFLFDRCLICTEVRKRRLAYRCHYIWENVELQLNNTKTIIISSKIGDSGQLKEELELTATEAITVSRWLRCARKIIEVARIEAAQRGKFTLPMDLVMGATFTLWLIWRYLY